MTANEDVRGAVERLNRYYDIDWDYQGSSTDFHGDVKLLLTEYLNAVSPSPVPPAAGERWENDARRLIDELVEDSPSPSYLHDLVRLRDAVEGMSRELAHDHADLERLREACRITALMRIGCECERCGPCLSRAALAAVTGERKT